jgi:hypothetical protein
MTAWADLVLLACGTLRYVRPRGTIRAAGASKLSWRRVPTRVIRITVSDQ